MMKMNVIILGAGNSTRFHNNENKIFMKINNKFILEYSIETFFKIRNITNIIVVYNKNDIEKINLIKKKYKKVKFIEGSISRQKSLINGITEIETNVDKVIIHDAARPMIYKDILEDMIQKSKNKKVLIPVRKATEGVKIIDKEDKIIKSMNRDEIVFCQTPQIFDKEIILKLKENTSKGIITFLLNSNIDISVFYSNKNLLKITTLDDFYYYDYLIRRMTLNEKN